MNLICVYRISSGGYPKDKPAFITKEKCLKNFLEVFSGYASKNPAALHIIEDAVAADLRSEIDKLVKASGVSVTRESTDYKNGAGSFNHAMTYALAQSARGNAVVYFVEDDYLHVSNALEVLMDAFKTPTFRHDYATLYDHPDKYVHGINPLVTSGQGELTNVSLAAKSHWRTTNSTTMTFATTLDTLAEDQPIWRAFTAGSHPHDFSAWLTVRTMPASIPTGPESPVTVPSRVLVSCIPGRATHGETAWMSPFVSWSSV